MTQVSIKPSCLTCRTYSGVKGQRVPKSPIRGEAKNKIKVLKKEHSSTSIRCGKEHKSLEMFTILIYWLFLLAVALQKALLKKQQI